MTPPIVDVGIDQDDRLPRAEAQPPIRHRENQGRTDQHRQQVIGSVTVRPVAVEISIVSGHESIDQLRKVRLRSRTQLHQRKSRRSVRGEHIAQAVSTARAKSGNLGGHIGDPTVPGVDVDQLTVQGSIFLSRALPRLARQWTSSLSPLKHHWRPRG